MGSNGLTKVSPSASIAQPRPKRIGRQTSMVRSELPLIARLTERLRRQRLAEKSEIELSLLYGHSCAFAFKDLWSRLRDANSGEKARGKIFQRKPRVTH
jgi:hypothetical protein